MTREELLLEVKAFYGQYVYLADMISVFHDSEKAEEAMIQEKKDCRVYFRLVCSACYDSLLMTLARMYDKNKDSETIPVLINKCKGHIDLFNHPEETSDYLIASNREINQDMNAVVKVVKARRNAFIAHNDKAHFLGNGASDTENKNDPAKTSLHMYDIWGLSRKTGEILRYLLCELSFNVDEITRQYNHEISEVLPNHAVAFNANYW